MRVNQEKSEQMGIKLRLKEVQLSKGLNLKEFSEVSGVSYRSLQNYLSGEREPNVTGLTNLCTRLGVNINWLLTGKGAMFVEVLNSPVTAQNKQEAELLEDYRESNEQGKDAIERTAKALANAAALENREIA
ncbi:TPA: helix-turn-helix domain-containing protein [Pasteurella multocida]|uniref:helix-turn-helix domain-containing protein n=1 Tax=Pasteurella multocida TaxID=747 RepID=UPI0020204418|nr:helix-turn-helix transcriptional regulator [Pasteurella multocida]MCL7850711.1 helix-turn-helix domain-containing protein [Pasteurella multocida]